QGAAQVPVGGVQEPHGNQYRIRLRHSRAATRGQDPIYRAVSRLRLAVNAVPLVGAWVRPDGTASAFDGSGEGDDLVMLKPRQPVEPRVLPRVTDVDDEHGALATVREEIGVDALSVIALHGSGGEAERAHSQDEISRLQGSVERRGLGPGRLVRLVLVLQL